MITFAPIGVDQGRLQRYQALFQTCFPHATKFTAAFLTWLYRDNPDGEAVGFDAFDGDRLAAHYVCIPARVRIGARLARALLSLNTATHPDYQGKGLFTKLAAMTYEAGAGQGFDCVYGVANQHSTPGFVRKLGFQLVQPLDAMVGFGGLGIDLSRVSHDAQFARHWTAESLAWRCGNPANPIRGRRRAGRLAFEASASGRLVAAHAELPLETDAAMTAQGGPGAPLRLHLGLAPSTAGGFRTYFHIPQALRPSPLNLIYRPLGGIDDRLEPGHVYFTFLDFDAY